MSFIEKNKAWLLPLLGVGVLGVVYMNIRTLSPSAPAPTPGAEAPPAAVQDPAAPVALPPAPEKTPNASEADLWADLRGFAVPPPALADENGFRDQARRSAVGALKPRAAQAALVIPAGVREPQPPPDPKEKGGLAAEPHPGPPPALDFLIHDAGGSRVWLEGRPYRSGQTVEGNTLSVGSIRSTSVELKGPKGKTRTILSTNPLHPSGPSARPAVEAP